MNVAIIVIETFIEADRLIAKAADRFGNRAYACAVSVLAGGGARTELRAWA